MRRVIRVRANGHEREVEAEDRALLVHFIREDLGLKGAHIGCLTGNCGACTVIMNGRPVKSCTVFSTQADGAELLTVEGLARGQELHPIQQAFMASFASQCGYCTPGMLMSAYHLLRENAHPSEEEIK